MDIVDPRIDPRLVPDGSRAVVIAEHQAEYRDLPSVRTPDGQVITRWSLTEDERRRVLAGEDLYVTILRSDIAHVEQRLRDGKTIVKFSKGSFKSMKREDGVLVRVS